MNPEAVDAEALVPVTFRVNGTPYDVSVPARRLLSDVLRHDLRLTGTHVGCEHGVCGACTVLVDGASVRSCLIFAVSLEGADVTTVEGCCTPDGGMGPVQQAFQDCHALQCGFCTPGFITTITAYLDDNADPTPEQAREAISGNLCRCTGYQNIVAAVLRAADLRAGGTAGPPGQTAGHEPVDGRTADGSSGRTEGPGASVAGSGGRPSGARPDGPGAPGLLGSPDGPRVGSPGTGPPPAGSPGGAIAPPPEDDA